MVPRHKITLRVPFSAGHRLLGHPGKCKYLHGHNYVAIVTLRTTGLDEQGMVQDFGIMKTVVKGWIDKFWDHNMILNQEDPLVVLAKKLETVSPGTDEIFGDKSPFVMDGNPTAENMAIVLYRILLQYYDADPNIVVASVEMQETDSCSATYSE